MALTMTIRCVWRCQLHFGQPYALDDILHQANPGVQRSMPDRFEGDANEAYIWGLLTDSVPQRPAEGSGKLYRIHNLWPISDRFLFHNIM